MEKTITKEYKCTERLELELRDEDEKRIENEYFIVPADSVWEKCDYATMSDVRLTTGDSWIEICDETLKTHFVEI